MTSTASAANPGTLYHQKVSAPDAAFVSGGLRSFFNYRSTNMLDATGGQANIGVVRAAAPSASIPGNTGTGEHFHFAGGPDGQPRAEQGFHMVVVTKGWLKFKYEGAETLVKAGDIVHQPIGTTERDGIRHVLFDWSYPTDINGNPTGEETAEYIEVMSPNFGTHQFTPSGAATLKP
ncbi:MAG: cupin [Micavibrio sp.]|nr:cupin [Micavibrio sp.]